MGHPFVATKDSWERAPAPTLRKSRSVGQPFSWWRTRDGETFFKMNTLMEAGFRH
jgi:hypothetical protein